jgi:DNA-binding transcriptional ArsR family regulator
MIPMATPKAAGAKAATKAAKGGKKEADRLAAEAKRAAARLKQVSDPTRILVVLMLSDGERHVGGLCEELKQSQPAVSHHLALMRHGGIIAPTRRGKNSFYCLTVAGEELAKVVKGLIG